MRVRETGRLGRHRCCYPGVGCSWRNAHWFCPLLLIWNTLGLIDIIFVVFSALRFGLVDWRWSHPLRELPLSLLPTFLVPLVIASRVLIFARLARTRISSQ